MSEALDANIAMWKMKQLVKSLQSARGAGEFFNHFPELDSILTDAIVRVDRDFYDLPHHSAKSPDQSDHQYAHSGVRNRSVCRFIPRAFLFAFSHRATTTYNILT